MTQVTPPNIIEIGGVHCAPGKPLPLNFQKIMESAPEVDNYDGDDGDDDDDDDEGDGDGDGDGVSNTHASR